MSLSKSYQHFTTIVRSDLSVKEKDAFGMSFEDACEHIRLISHNYRTRKKRDGFGVLTVYSRVTDINCNTLCTIDNIDRKTTVVRYEENDEAEELKLAMEYWQKSGWDFYSLNHFIQQRKECD